jgi:hypothetical protein
MAIIWNRINGMVETGKALKGLTEPKFRKAALRKAGKVAMSPVLSAVKTSAPAFTNLSKLPKGARPMALKNDIKMSVSVNISPSLSKSGKITKSSQSELRVIIKTGKETEKYALVSEYGRVAHSFMKYTVFGKPVLGFVATLPELKPEPWMRPTYDRMQTAVAQNFADELAKSIIVQAKKQKKYLGK